MFNFPIVGNLFIPLFIIDDSSYRLYNKWNWPSGFARRRPLPFKKKSSKHVIGKCDNIKLRGVFWEIFFKLDLYQLSWIEIVTLMGVAAVSMFITRESSTVVLRTEGDVNYLARFSESSLTLESTAVKSEKFVSWKSRWLLRQDCVCLQSQ